MDSINLEYYDKLINESNSLIKMLNTCFKCKCDTKNTFCISVEVKNNFYKKNFNNLTYDLFLPEEYIFVCKNCFNFNFKKCSKCNKTVTTNNFGKKHYKYFTKLKNICKKCVKEYYYNYKLKKKKKSDDLYKPKTSSNPITNTKLKPTNK